MAPTPTLLGDRLILLRQAHGLEQHELARRAGIPQPTLNRIELGRRANPAINTVRKIAVAFPLTPLEYTAWTCPELLTEDAA